MPTSPPRPPRELPPDEAVAWRELAGLAQRPLDERDAEALELASWAVAQIRREMAWIRELALAAEAILAALAVDVEGISFEGAGESSADPASKRSAVGGTTPPALSHLPN